MAAGQGFKTFATGDVLSAADVNGYLMQGVLVFADSAERDAEITSPQEGQYAYLKDTNVTYYYSGSTWVSTAGAASPLTTKGDLYTFDTADARLGVGANGTVLTADSAEATGLKWAAPAAAGKVLQVVSAAITTSTAITSTSLTDTNITLNITPTLATSKVLVLIDMHRKTFRGTAASITGFSVLRGATSIMEYGNNAGFGIEAGGATSIQIIDQAPVIYLDSPATTSATTYKVQARVESAGETVTYQFSSKPSTITLMEIGV